MALGGVARLHDVGEDLVGARARGCQIDVRGKTARRLEHAGEHRRFGKVHLADRFAEVKLRGRFHAIRPASQIGAVEIELKQLRLGVVVFQVDGDEGFFDLTAEGAFRR